MSESTVRYPIWPFQAKLFILAPMYGGLIGAVTGCAVAVSAIGLAAAIVVGGLFGLLYGVVTALFATLISAQATAWISSRYESISLTVTFGTLVTLVCALLLPLFVPPSSGSGLSIYIALLGVTWVLSWTMAKQARKSSR